MTIMIKTAKDLGSVLRGARRSAGLTQRDVALVANVGERFVVEVENGKDTCQLGRVLRVARAVGVSLNAKVPEQ